MCCQEGQERVGALEDQSPEIFERVLLYLYTNSYNLADVIVSNDERQSSSPTRNIPSPNPGPTDAMALVPFHGDSPTEKDESKNNDLGAVHNNIDRHTADLHTHVGVHNFAEFLQIPDLQTIALTRVESSLLKHFPAKDHQAALEEGFTGSSSLELKTLVMKVCLKNRKKVHQDIINLFMEHEPLAWSMAQIAHNDASRQQQESSRIIANLHDQLAEERVKVEMNEEVINDNCDQLEIMQDHIDHIVRSVNERDQCRNGSCNQEFGAHLQMKSTATGRVWNLRCNKCKCKHPL